MSVNHAACIPFLQTQQEVTEASEALHWLYVISMKRTSASACTWVTRPCRNTTLPTAPGPRSIPCWSTVHIAHTSQTNLTLWDMRPWVQYRWPSVRTILAIPAMLKLTNMLCCLIFMEFARVFHEVADVLHMTAPWHKLHLAAPLLNLQKWDYTFCPVHHLAYCYCQSEESSQHQDTTVWHHMSAPNADTFVAITGQLPAKVDWINFTEFHKYQQQHHLSRRLAVLMYRTNHEPVPFNTHP